MPKTKTEIILQVFVGSPGDVKDERIALEEVIREFNNTWSDVYNIRLELIQWETHASPAIAEDAQAAINEQIPDTYDIFIGIFWSRLGTPTNRAKSGTVEEFNQAYERYKVDPNSIEIMVYFKETPIKPSQIDHQQMKEVIDFKSYVSNIGLFFEFDSTDSFKNLVRNHLNQKIKKWAERYYGKPLPQNETQSTTEVKSPTADELIDGKELVEKIENSNPLIERVTFTLNHIVRIIDDLGKKLNKRNTNSIMQKKVLDMTVNDKEILKTVTNASLFLTDFARRMKFEIPLFKESLRMAIGPYTNILGIRKEFSNDHSNIIQSTLEAASTFRMVTIKSNVKIKSFRKCIEGFQWKGPGFESACNNALESIDKLLHNIENAKQQATKVETYLSELL